MILKNLLFIITCFHALIFCSASHHNSTSTNKQTDNFINKNHSADKLKKDSVATTLIYLQAIKKYIEAVYKKDKTVLDTLFIIRRINGQVDDFPDINLPTSLKKTRLIVLSQNESENIKHLFKKTSPCVNIIGWIEEQKAEFIFVTFFPELQHSFDYHMLFKRFNGSKSYHFETLYTKEFNKK